MKVRILRAAYDDLAAGRRFYDRQQLGVGSYFFDSVFSEIDSLALYAGVHRVVHGYHRMLARRFPYAVYYRVTGDEAVVHRVLDCRRDPKWTQESLETSG
ncbi:MAG TPA: type II toxin-antitoxin system RelE/ParE family toxin [Opitutaceae bacterium]|nr:type II toxin-antitoxin system RelE/ParE family toxin [Opitutaceae bacterium]